jgi:hypothetical protein
MGSRVLVVEDDRLLGAQIVERLGAGGYETVWLRTGRLREQGEGGADSICRAGSGCTSRGGWSRGLRLHAELALVSTDTPDAEVCLEHDEGTLVLHAAPPQSERSSFASISLSTRAASCSLVKPGDERDRALPRRCVRGRARADDHPRASHRCHAIPALSIPDRGSVGSSPRLIRRSSASDIAD